MTWKILDYDHLEFFVGNAKQQAYYYRAALGFTLKAYAGLETGVRTHASYLLQQGNIRFVLTTPLGPEHIAAEHIKKHGDGVRSITLQVDDCEAAYRDTLSKGATSVTAPHVVEDSSGSVKTASIATYGDTLHTFLERKNYKGIFLPGFEAIEKDILCRPTELKFIDHVVGNVEWHKMNDWVDYYEKVFGFHRFWSVDDKTLHTEYSALNSTVVSDRSGKIKFPINEPAQGKRKSQIEEYCDYYRSAGVQHIAMHTNDIIEAVTKLTENGVEFLRIPASYYEALEQRVGKIDEDMKTLGKLGILVDRDEHGYMLQLFTKPIEDRPTVFLEVIQRKGAKSFGIGNFKALFEAIERDQAARGNL